MITLIGACGLNREIGKDNKLLWHLPNDLKRFKAITIGTNVVMGRKTFESIGKPLPNRKNIVLSNSKLEYDKIDQRTFEEILNLPSEMNINVIGGQSIYEQFLPYADRILLTIVDQKFPKADTFFPELPYEWLVEDSVRNYADDNHDYDYYYVTYRKAKDFFSKRLTKTN